ncbi:MAG: hypothetical protein HY270_05175 [Deltaproteobacteria bacterium]|nr:hypothetical protein [Deltaproteobacteria bacterium]
MPAVSIHNTLATENRHPPLRFNNGAIGLRFASTTNRVDWSVCYYEGPETAPGFAFNTIILAPRARQLIETGSMPKVSDLQPLQANATLLPRFGHIRLFGGDAAVALGGFTLRAEAAYGSDRLLPRSTADLLSTDNLRNAVRPQIGAIIAQLLQGQSVPINLGDLFVQRDTIEWGAGVDYTFHGWTPVFQINQMFILRNSSHLLINDVDTRLLIAVRKSFFAERLRTELVAFQGLERSYTAGILRLHYAFNDAFSLGVGYLLLAGSRHTVVGQYHDNDEAFVQLRYER